MTVEILGWIEIDSLESLEALIERASLTGGIHPNILAAARKQAPQKSVRRQIVLYNFGAISTEDAIRQIQAAGDRPCGIYDGFGITGTFPNRQKQNPLVLLDKLAVCPDGYGRRCAPVLRGWYGRRRLSLSLLAGDWYGHHCFPAVREEKPLGT